MPADHWLAEVLDVFDQIDQYLPGSKTIVGEFLYGKVPQANDERLHDLADAWAAARDQVNAFAADIYRAADPILQGWGGDGAAMQFQQNWQQYLEQVEQAVSLYSGMADLTSGFALEVETEKFMTALNLCFLIGSLIMIIATLAISFGSSALAAPGAFAVAREAIAVAAREALEKIGSLGARLLTKDVLKNITARSVADKLAGQFFKDVIRKEMRQALTKTVDAGARKALIRGAYQMRKELADKITADLTEKWTGKVAEDAAAKGLEGISDEALNKIISDGAESTFGKEFTKYLAPKLWQGAKFMGGQDLFVQSMEMLAGDRSGIDGREAGTAALQGAVMGGLMGGRSYLGQMASGATAGLATAAIGDGLAVWSGNADDVHWKADLEQGAGSGAAMAGFFHVQHGVDAFGENLSIAANNRIGQETHVLIDPETGAISLDIRSGDLHIDRQLGGVSVVEQGGKTTFYDAGGASITEARAMDLGYQGGGGGGGGPTVADRPTTSASGGTAARETGATTSNRPSGDPIRRDRVTATEPGGRAADDRSAPESGVTDAAGPGRADTADLSHADTAGSGHADTAGPGRADAAGPRHTEAADPGRTDPSDPRHADAASPGHADAGSPSRSDTGDPHRDVAPPTDTDRPSASGASEAGGRSPSELPAGRMTEASHGDGPQIGDHVARTDHSVTELDPSRVRYADPPAGIHDHAAGHHGADGTHAVGDTPEVVRQPVAPALPPVDVADGGRVWRSELPTDLAISADDHVGGLLRAAGEPHTWVDGQPPQIELRVDGGIDAQLARHIEHLRSDFDQRNPDGTPVRRPRVTVVGQRTHGEPMHLSDEIREQDARDRVPYLDAQARARYEVRIVDGRLYDQDDVPLHGHYVYVTEPGTHRAYAMEWGEEGRLGAKHSSLLAGGDVESAGEMRIEHGHVTELDNNSGHYVPTADHIFAQRDVLAAKGADLSGAHIRVVGPDRTPFSRSRGDASFRRAVDELGRPGEIDGVRRVESAPMGRDAAAGADATVRVTTTDGRVLEINATRVRDYLSATRPDGPDIDRFAADRRLSTPDADLAHQGADLLRSRIEGALDADRPSEPVLTEPTRPPRALADLDRALAGRLGEPPLLDADGRAVEPPPNPDAVVSAVRAVSDAQIHADVDAAGLPVEQADALKASLIDRRDAVIRQHERPPNPEEVRRMTDAARMYVRPETSGRDLYDVLREESHRKTADFSTGLTVHEAARALDDAAAVHGEPGGYAGRLDDFLNSPEGRAYHEDLVHLDLATAHGPHPEPDGVRFHEPSDETAAEAVAGQFADRSPAQRDALDRYAGPGSHTVDRYLRTDGQESGSGRADAFKIQSAMRPTDVDLRLHGGLDLRDLGVHDHGGLADLVGTSITVKGFLRVSGEEFGSAVHGDVRIDIDAPAGTHAVWMRAADGDRAGDLLLAAGTDLRVVDLTRLGADRYELRVRVDGYEDPAGLTGRLTHGGPADTALHDHEHLPRHFGDGRSNADVLEHGGDVPQTLDEVRRVADLIGIDLTGIRVDLVTDPVAIAAMDRRGLSAVTPLKDGGRVVRLGPAAFADRETLAATVAHEYQHVEQLRRGAEFTSDENRAALEHEADASEQPALERLRAGGEDGTHDDPVLSGDDLRPEGRGGPPGGGLDPGRRDQTRDDPGGRDGSPDHGADGRVREPGGPQDRPDDTAAGSDHAEPGERGDGTGDRGDSDRTAGVRVLRDLPDDRDGGAGGDADGTDRDVQRGDARPAEDDAVQPGPEGVEVQPGGGGAVPLRPDVPGGIEADHADRGGTDRAGLGDPAAERDGAAPADPDRGSGADGDGRDRVTPDVASGDVASNDGPADHTGETDAQRLERLAPGRLTDDQRQEIADAVGDGARRLADETLVKLDTIAGAVHGEMVDTKFRLKSAESVARKYLEVEDSYTVGEFLGSVNDLIRFSMELPENRYDIHSVLAELQMAGFRKADGSDLIDTDGAANFWRPGNRFYGLNMTLREPSTAHHLIELQFPTELSRHAGKQTHVLYETVRQPGIDFEERLDAHLTILQINKAEKLAEHLPDLSGLPEETRGELRLPEAKRVGFADWVEKFPGEWRRYLDSLPEGVTFEQVLARYDLTPRDIPRAGDIGLADHADDPVSHEHPEAPAETALDDADRIQPPVEPESDEPTDPTGGAEPTGPTDPHGGPGPIDQAAAHDETAPHDETAVHDASGGHDDGAPSQLPPADDRIGVADAQHAVLERLDHDSPELGSVVAKLLGDEAHALNLTESLRSPERQEQVLKVLEDLATGEALEPYEGQLPEFLAEHPGHGPMFEPVRSEINRVVGDDGVDRTRLDVYVAKMKAGDPALTVGPDPSSEQTALVKEYAERLKTQVEPAVRREILAIVAEIQADADGWIDVNSRSKKTGDLIDKVQRMAAGRENSPGRPHYRVGDAIDAVGARITVPDMRTLERALAAVVDRFGTGDGGRIVEIDNMYASPKSKSPEYRVIPMVVAIEVGGRPYSFELQLTTLRASVAADIEHNSIYKPYVPLSPLEELAVWRAFREAAALDQLETEND